MQEIIVKNKKFVVEEVKASHEDHVTYIATHNNIRYLLRCYKSGYERALSDYKFLKKAGINMSRLCFHDDVNKVLVLDSFKESTVLDKLSEGDLPDEYFDALFRLYRFARFAKTSLDWQPQNFMLRGNEMFYLPIKVEPMAEGNRLEDGGILYWFRGKEGLNLLQRKGYDVSGVKPQDVGEVNKKIVLLSIKNW